MGLVDKINKLFKTDAYKLKVILAQDIQEEVDFVKFHETMVIQSMIISIDDSYTLFMMLEMLSKNEMLRKRLYVLKKLKSLSLNLRSSLIKNSLMAVVDYEKYH